MRLIPTAGHLSRPADPVGGATRHGQPTAPRLKPDTTKAKKIWLFLERTRPPLWCVRFGYTWHLAKRVLIRIPMQTKSAKRQPVAYLCGTGVLKRKGDTIILCPPDRRS